ncbi:MULTISPECIES: hypothetical protein [Shewanella]|uniref:CD-NTase-associated protein 12/Pycsar effector protein TIR domain-containing protein n=1 Tax=Shewanella cutis TaxID=2766780 RepID=A0ABS9QX10_9GAMM|nr:MULTISPECIES: hypothetical protein [unclassified Shewanella]MCG9964901.1 hypothetical protein [Shewanella sp. PS-2]NSM23019.1 hypothetical protein [Shewanella sp. ZOR0012]
MKRTIFYSWQSDLPSKGNRNLIEDSLKRALNAIKKSDSESVEPALDRDTAGISGSPSISESIFSKIAVADVFVADVSIINGEGKGKKTPNPNVLIELGYAVSQLGWERVILVQNTFYGEPEALPFDLRGRRVVTYEFNQDLSDRPAVRGLLQGRLESAIKSALEISSTDILPTGKNAPIWWGIWKKSNPGKSYGGELFIRDITSNGFLFDLMVFNGSHTGTITAEAICASKDSAYARIENGPDKKFGEIHFRREFQGGKRLINIEETSSCNSHRGMGVLFAGEFTWSTESVFEFGYLNEMELKRLYELTGQYFFEFRKRMEGVGERDNLDTFQCKVVAGGVRGMYTYYEGIVMSGTRGEMWAAYIDSEAEAVRYFTTQKEWQKCLPKTIESWRESFNDKRVLFEHDIEVVPSGIFD